MSDVVGKYLVELNYDTASATLSLRDFRAKAIADVKAIGDALNKIDELKGLQNGAKAAKDRVAELAKQSDDVRKALAGLSKESVGFKLIERELKTVVKEFGQAVREADRLDTKIGKLSNTLAQAGIDTKSLATEELRLAQSLQAAAAAAEVAQARNILGVKSMAEQRAELQRLQQAYETLRRSGASIQELADAKMALRLRTQELAQAQVGVTNNMQQLGIAVAGVLGSTLAYTRAAREVIASAARYEQGLASIASITQLNKVQLDVLGDSVLRLAGRIGIDLPTAFKALYNIIGSGIPPENAISVLEASAKAAVAGITTIDNAARIGVQVLNAYQLQASQLPKVFDILFQTVRDGVISFEELADKFGLVLPAARTAGVSLEELSGAVVVLTRAGLNAPRAMVALEGAIKQLAAPTPEAAAEMARLGISFNGLVGTVEQLVKLNVGPGTLRKLIPDVEGQRAVALFTQNYELLKNSVQEAGRAANATQEAFDKLKNTPEQQLKIFNAELERSKVALGKALLEGALPLLRGLTDLLKMFNELSPATKNMVAIAGSLAGALTVGAVAAKTLAPILVPLAAGLAATGAAGQAGALGVRALQLAVSGLLPAVAAGAAGFALGEKLRETSAEAQRLGDFLGGNFAAIVIQLGNRFDQFKAFVSGNTEEYKRASAALQANVAQYNEFKRTLVDVGFEITQLRVKQTELRQAVEQAQANVGAASAKYIEAFAPIQQKVTDAVAEFNRNIAISESALNTFRTTLAATEAASKSLFENQGKALEQDLAARLQALQISFEQGKLSQLQLLQQTAQAEVANYTLRLTAQREFATTTLKIFEQDAAARRALAVKTGEDQVKVDIELRNSKIALLTEIRTRYEQTYAALAQQEQNLLKIAKAADEERRISKLSVEEKIREVQRGLLTPYEQYYDRVKEIDRALAQSREAYLKGNLDQAKDYAKKAIDLSANIGQAVTDKEGNVVISARRAATEATDKLRESGNQLDLVLKKQGDSARTAATAFGEQGAAARKGADETAKAIDGLVKTTVPIIKPRIEADAENIAAETAKIIKLVEESKPIAKVDADVKQAEAAYNLFKKYVEDNRPQADIEAKFEDFKTKVDAAVKAVPTVGLKVDSEPVTAALAGIKTSVEALGQSKINLQSNVDEIKQKLETLKVPTQSTHTVKEVYVRDPNRPPEVSGNVVGANTGGFITGDTLPGFNTGGVVRESMREKLDRALAQPGGIQRFARGGFVGLVGGSGNRDTEFFNLQSGSFVLNQANSNRLLGAVNTSGAGGGKGDDLVATLRAKKVFERGSLLRTVLNSALDYDLKTLRKYASVSGTSIDTAAEYNTRQYANQRAASLLAGYRNAADQRDTSRAEGFTVDAINAFESAKKAFEGLDIRGRFAEGGNVEGGASVPALLTPGELVFSPEEVSRIGLQKLQAMNAAKTPAQFDEAMLAKFKAGGPVLPSFADRFGEVAGPMLRRFNEGGYANSTVNNASSNTTNMNNVININAGNADVRQLARAVRAEIDNMDRRSK